MSLGGWNWWEVNMTLDLEGQKTVGRLGEQQGLGWTVGSPGSYVEPLIDGADPPAPGPLLFPLSLPVF